MTLARLGPLPATIVVDGRPWRLRRVLWRHPEWWSVASSGIAWLILAARAAGGGSALAWTHAHGDGRTGVAWHDVLDVLLMIVAMMIPFVLEPVRTAARRSLWARRHRAIAAFLAGFVIVWMVVGLVLAALGLWLGQLADPAATTAGALAVAALWHLAPARRRAVVAGHRTVPLAPRGWRADRDCLRYGWTNGTRCVASCWALMGVCVVAGHALSMMALATGVQLLDRVAMRSASHAPPRAGRGGQG